MADSSSNRGRGGRGRNQGGRSRGRGGGRGGRGGFGAKGRKGDSGRSEYNRLDVDKRQRNEDHQDSKRRKLEAGDEAASHPFSKEEIEEEGRKPKRKVAVMIGYAGTGYKGMQINGSEKTIEGDLFKAFVAAGAISKANADDPKKSSLVRCARTDKGVHAAGNVISLKLIVEEADIIQKINENLPPQIRIWGIERTNGSFSCYQTCDSRWYEYLIPTFAFIPPHPQSFMAKKLIESAEKEGVYETFQSRQEDAATFWKDAEEKYVKPILNSLDSAMAEEVMKLIHSDEEEAALPKKQLKKVLQAARQPRVPKQDGVTGAEIDNPIPAEAQVKTSIESIDEGLVAEDQKAVASAEEIGLHTNVKEELSGADEAESIGATISNTATQQSRDVNQVMIETGNTDQATDSKLIVSSPDPAIKEEATVEADETRSILTPLEIALKQVKAAYITAKKAYRISAIRRARVQETLECYLGTRNFHNYTIQKTFKDPSAKRVIRSFKVGDTPVIINDTEWLSLKVHGQSFMMHQIRKMVAMAAIVVRCGSPLSIIKDSYGPANISIPKAPGLGLLLERPVFDSYNEKAVKEFNYQKIDFNKYQKEMDEFKQRQIYDRIFREEEASHQYHVFFHHIDHYKTDYFLWATASGVGAATQSTAPGRTDEASEDEEADANGQEG